MRKRIVLGLTGPAGCGKSTAARILREQHGFVELTFKEAMLRPLCVLFGVPSTYFDDPEIKEVPQEVLMYKSPRHVMQTFGTEWGRDLIHKGIWVEMVRRELEGYPTEDIVISDVRFNNEAAFIQGIEGYTLQLRRDKFQVQAAPHSSEAGIDPCFIDHRVIAYKVPNPGDTTMLELQLLELVKDFKDRV